MALDMEVLILIRAAMPKSNMRWKKICITAGNVNEAPPVGQRHPQAKDHGTHNCGVTLQGHSPTPFPDQ